MTGRRSWTLRLLACPWAWVISVTTFTPRSPPSLAAVTANAGAEGNDEQPLTGSGALALRSVESL